MEKETIKYFGSCRDIYICYVCICLGSYRRHGKEKANGCLEFKLYRETRKESGEYWLGFGGEGWG